MRMLWMARFLLLCVPATIIGQEMPAPPIPIWDGQGNIPQSSSNRKVFLTPDEHSVIVLWPNQDGTVSRKRFDLHNTIYPNLRVHIEVNSGEFRYRYDLENGKQSKDTLRDFSLVIYPDPEIQASSALWRGGFTPPTLKERIGIPGAPPGEFGLWMGIDEQSLLPGASTNFTLVTRARPGFTSASTEHFPHIELTDEWPEEILDQFGDTLEPKWIAYHFITLGPRYGPDDPDTGIAADYLVGIQELIRTHRLVQDSLFVKEAIADLDAITSGSSAHFSIRQKPSSELETEILSALELSLHISYNVPQ